MPATGAIISFCLAETRLATAGPDAGVYDKYGDSARATEEPVETFFDSMDDVQEIADARLDLLKADRRKFNAEVRGESAVLGLSYAPATPTVTFIDDERATSLPVAVVEIGIDFETGNSTLAMWG